MVSTVKRPRFQYQPLAIGSVRVTTTYDEKKKMDVADKVIINDEHYHPNDRFWTSLYARYGFNKSIFKYFSHAEVFERIAEVAPDDRIRVCIERPSDDSQPQLLAVSNPTKPIAEYNRVMELLDRYNSEEAVYTDGIVSSTHQPRVGGNFMIGPDQFENRFVLQTPIDGYGSPCIFLSLLRMLCMNGAVAMSREFKSDLALGKGDDDVSESLTRALDGFNSDEGFTAIRERFESAQKSWASIYEVQSLHNHLVKFTAHNLIGYDGAAAPGGDIARTLSESSGVPIADIVDETVNSPVLKAFHFMSGDLSSLYGLANLEALSAKRQRTLPAKCTVYDLINFASELASHHTGPKQGRQLQGWIGNLVANEYDMEGTKDQFSEFKDFHMAKKLDGEAAKDLAEVGG